MDVQDVLRPVLVRSVKLDLARLPSWQPVLRDLPVGCGIKGGIARKILKVIVGLNGGHPDFVAELNGEGDLDILVAVRRLVPSRRLELRQVFTGRQFGMMRVEAKDVEVCDDLARYFRTRDVTMNEVLVFRLDADTVELLFTEEATRDVASGTVRPAIHCLHTGFHQTWMYNTYSQPIVAPRLLVRTILRFLKGHGVTYAVDPETWTYYREVGPLGARELFRLLRHWADDDEKFVRAVNHLKDLNLLAGETDGNRLWGECLLAMNEALARYGRRLTFAEPTALEIENWIASKEGDYQRWLERRATQTAVGITVEPDLTAEVKLPIGWHNFPVPYE